MKGYFEDIRPKRERVVEKNIPVPDAPSKPQKKASRVKEPTFQGRSLSEESGLSSYHRESNSSSKKIIGLILLVIACVAGAIYGLSFVFRGATITVTPKSVSGTLNDLALSASQAPGSPILYSTMTISDSISKQYAATATDISGSKATGTAILYNLQSTPVSLVAMTRLEDPNGDIFRLQNPVTIPKRSVVKGQTVPGQVQVTLVADAVGPAGNIGLSDFNIVAYAGTARAKLVYGRGNSVFTGGATGDVYYLNNSDYAAIAPALSSQLATQLQAEALKQVPDGYILLPGSLKFTPDPANKNPAPASIAMVTVTFAGSESGILIKKSDLETAYINAIAPDETITPDQVSFVGEDALTYAPTTVLTGATTPDPITFTVSGPLTLVWNINPTVIIQALAGVPRASFATRMQVFSSVKSASLVIIPFWINMLPTDQTKIHVVVTNS